MNDCIYLDRLNSSKQCVCTAFVDWWEKEVPKDIIYLTEENCMCELYEKKQ
ncbi:MAG: hypothetical protein RR585_13665 [Coprobacillus sp.]